MVSPVFPRKAGNASYQIWPQQNPKNSLSASKSCHDTLVGLGIPEEAVHPSRAQAMRRRGVSG